MDFGSALNNLRAGRRVARKGWNGEGMWLVLVPGSSIRVETDRPLGKAAPDLVGRRVGYQPHIDMMTAQGSIVPWLASQTDMLATDWYNVDAAERAGLRWLPAGEAAGQPHVWTTGKPSDSGGRASAEPLPIAGRVRVSWHSPTPDDPAPATLRLLEVSDADTGEALVGLTAMSIRATPGENDDLMLVELTEFLDREGRPYRRSAKCQITANTAAHTYLLAPTNRPQPPVTGNRADVQSKPARKPEAEPDRPQLKTLFDMFAEFVADGFTEDQAMRMIAELGTGMHRKLQLDEAKSD